MDQTNKTQIINNFNNNLKVVDAPLQLQRFGGVIIDGVGGLGEQVTDFVDELEKTIQDPIKFMQKLHVSNVGDEIINKIEILAKAIPKGPILSEQQKEDLWQMVHNNSGLVMPIKLAVAMEDVPKQVPLLPFDALSPVASIARSFSSTQKLFKQPDIVTNYEDVLAKSSRDLSYSMLDTPEQLTKQIVQWNKEHPNMQMLLETRKGFDLVDGKDSVHISHEVVFVDFFQVMIMKMCQASDAIVILAIVKGIVDLYAKLDKSDKEKREHPFINEILKNHMQAYYKLEKAYLLYVSNVYLSNEGSYEGFLSRIQTLNVIIAQKIHKLEKRQIPPKFFDSKRWLELNALENQKINAVQETVYKLSVADAGYEYFSKQLKLVHVLDECIDSLPRKRRDAKHKK